MSVETPVVTHSPECPSVFNDTKIPCICEEIKRTEQRVAEQLLNAISTAAVDGFALYRDPAP